MSMIEILSKIQAEEFFSTFVKLFINKFLDLASTTNFLIQCIAGMCLSWESLSQRLHFILLDLKIFYASSQVRLLRWLSDLGGGLLGVMGNEVAALAAMSAHLNTTREAAVSRSYPLTA